MAQVTTKGYKVIFALAIILIASVVVWYFFFRNAGCDPNRNGFTKSGKPSSKCVVKDPSKDNTPAIPGTSGWISDSSFPIKRGSWGPKVKALQEKLGVSADGKFGPITEAALQKRTGKIEISNQAEYDSIVGVVVSGTSTSKNSIDDYLGTYVNTGNIDGAVMRYVNDNSEFKKYGKNANIGRIGTNIGDGYHKMFDVPGDNSILGLKMSDSYLKAILKIK